MNNSSDSLASLIFIGLGIAYITINFYAIIELFIFIAIIAIPCGILYSIINTIENYFKNRKIRANAWKIRNNSKRYNKYVMHVEEVANRYCRIYNKNKNNVIAKYRKRHPYITIKGKIYR